MARQQRLSFPPSTGNQALDQWLNQIYDSMNLLPPFSTFSTANGPNSSNVTATSGTLGFEIGSAVTKLWLNKTGTGSGWSAIL